MLYNRILIWKSPVFIINNPVYCRTLSTKQLITLFSRFYRLQKNYFELNKYKYVNFFLFQFASCRYMSLTIIFIEKPILINCIATFIKIWKWNVNIYQYVIIKLLGKNKERPAAPFPDFSIPLSFHFHHRPHSYHLDLHIIQLKILFFCCLPGRSPSWKPSS